jgi:hypothetical protein
MNKYLTLILLLGYYLNSQASPPTPPVLTLIQAGAETTAQWTTVDNATGYTLYYAPYPQGEPIGQAEMANNTHFTTTLPDNVAYYVAIRAYNSEGSSEYSNIDFFSLPPLSPSSHNTLVNESDGNWQRDPTSPGLTKKDYLRTSACQTVGVVYQEVTNTTYQMNVIKYSDGSSLTVPVSAPLPPGQTVTTVTQYKLAQAALVYYEVDRHGLATNTTLFTTETAIPPETWSLVFDSSCHPHVLRLVGNRYEHWQRKGRLWVKTELSLNWEALGEISSIQPGTALLGQDNRVHLLFNVTLADNSKRFVNATLLYNDWQGGVWQTQLANTLLTNESWGNQTLDYAVDQPGTVHVIYALEVEGVKRNLQYAQLHSDTWQAEVVFLGEDVIGQGFTTVASNASLALDNQGQPVIASLLVRHVDTGSYQSAQLLYHTRVNGQWQNQVIAQESDNYAGTDGTHFTGSSPHLIFDPKNRPHLVFSDIASWHNSQGSNETISGQLRYATLTNSGSWVLETITKQTGQSISPNPLNGLIAPTLAITPEGKRLVFAGTEFSAQATSLIYSLADITTHYRLQVILRDLF